MERLLGPAHQDRVEECLELYLDHYTRHNGELTRLYPGVPETLARLSGKRLAVLSNKLQRLTQQALEAVDLARFFTAIRGGGGGLPLKPAPEPLLALAADLGVGPSRSLMVGDKIADIKTGREAGAFTAAVTYGYGDLDGPEGGVSGFSAGAVCPIARHSGRVRHGGPPDAPRARARKMPDSRRVRPGINPAGAGGRGPQFCLTEPALLNIFSLRMAV